MSYGTVCISLTADRDKEVLLCPLEGKTSLCLRSETSDSDSDWSATSAL